VAALEPELHAFAFGTGGFQANRLGVLLQYVRDTGHRPAALVAVSDFVRRSTGQRHRVSPCRPRGRPISERRRIAEHHGICAAAANGESSNRSHSNLSATWSPAKPKPRECAAPPKRCRAQASIRHKKPPRDRGGVPEPSFGRGDISVS